ncbi:hypothetical protein TGPRC2_201760 [Toxoplasma gondii TgCatPRC2]|uniref:Uncharacterized protein n=1 Tax=Toxoplasma gondii TgCatPRC2 TaxID=1130821 RepID=A0A151HBC4_TOXGO|nr:hypothetical protein TGPRC2_201760 [Toxoplasma gondii TgCatPRC2]
MERSGHLCKMEPWKQKVPQCLSLHGSNSLRGGKRTYNCNVLMDNWRNDRLDAHNDQKLTSWRIPHPLYTELPQGSKYETHYRQSYDYEDWARRPVRLSKYGLLGHDDSGAESWTTETRSEYEPPRLRRDQLKAAGQWPYGEDIYPRHVHGNEEFMCPHPMAIHVSRTHREDYIRSLTPRPAYERPPAGVPSSSGRLPGVPPYANDPISHHGGSQEQRHFCRMPCRNPSSSSSVQGTTGVDARASPAGSPVFAGQVPAQVKQEGGECGQGYAGIAATEDGLVDHGNSQTDRSAGQHCMLNASGGSERAHAAANTSTCPQRKESDPQPTVSWAAVPCQ